MTIEPGWIPPEIDTTKANIARVYDYWLGGTHNFQADRDMARTAIAMNPDMRSAARAFRGFLGRTVRYMAGQGIRQFLDIGSGIPTNQNVHEVAQTAAPGSRVIYVDHDEIAVAHSRLMLETVQNCAIIQADLRQPAEILSAPETQLLLDFDQPIGVIMSLVLHFIPDDTEAAAIVATLRDALAPGSYVAVAHACLEQETELLSSFASTYNHRVDAQYRPRTRDEITGLLDGFELLDPGLVWASLWRPDSPDDVPEHPETCWGVVGLARYDGLQENQ